MGWASCANSRPTLTPGRSRSSPSLATTTPRHGKQRSKPATTIISPSPLTPAGSPGKSQGFSADRNQSKSRSALSNASSLGQNLSFQIVSKARRRWLPSDRRALAAAGRGRTVRKLAGVPTGFLVASLPILVSGLCSRIGPRPPARRILKTAAPRLGRQPGTEPLLRPAKPPVHRVAPTACQLAGALAIRRPEVSVTWRFADSPSQCLKPPGDLATWRLGDQGFSHRAT